MAISVELIQQTVKRALKELGTKVDENIPQLQIFGQVTDEAGKPQGRRALLGYVGTDEAAPINLIVTLPDQLRQSVIDQVGRLKNAVSELRAVDPPDPEALKQLNEDRSQDELEYDETEASVDETTSA